MNARAESLEIELFEAFEFLLYPKRIKVPFGGRGGAKSEEIAEILVWFAWQHGDRILCGREFMNSIEESSQALLVAKIEKFGLQDFFDVQRDGIYGRNGSCFKFVGLSRNITSLKSKFGFNKVWIEEAENVSEESWKVLIPTVREANSEIWISFNPGEPDAPTYARFVLPYIEHINREVAAGRPGYYEDDYIYVRKVSWRDNPRFPEVLRIEMERDKAANYKKYLHVWEGECNADYEDSVIEPEWVDAAIDAHKRLNYTPRGDRVIGFDPADSGADAKGLTKRYGMLVEDVKRWSDGDIDDAITRTFDDAFDYRADIIVYDSIGVGAGVKVGLKERIAGRNIDVQGFGAGDSPWPGVYEGDRKNEDVFRNLRAMGWWLLADRFRRTYEAVVKGEYHDPATMISLSSDIKDLQQLKTELVRQQRKRTSGSKMIQLVSKDEMRAKKVPSPNMADSLMMSFMVRDKPKQIQAATPIPSASAFRRR
jgi:phage terminase large subunit